jgi:hypothetical protein
MAIPWNKTEETGREEGRKHRYSFRERKTT